MKFRTIEEQKYSKWQLPSIRKVSRAALSVYTVCALAFFSWALVDVFFQVVTRHLN